jgi:hypothetical protein
MQNFNSLAFTQTDLDKFLTIFQVNFRIFLKKNSKISKSEKIQIEHRERHILPTSRPSSILTKKLKVI